MSDRFFAHPSALVETDAVGAGTRIWAFTHVLAGATIGANCNIGDALLRRIERRRRRQRHDQNGNAIWQGVTLEDGVFVGPSVVFTNDLRPRSPRLPEAAARYDGEGWLVPTRVCRGSTLGAGAIVLGGVTIGEFAFVAAGALVTRDVPPHALVMGSPARHRGWVCRCGASLEPGEDSVACASCGRAYAVAEGRVVLTQD